MWKWTTNKIASSTFASSRRPRYHGREQSPPYHGYSSSSESSYSAGLPRLSRRMYRHVAAPQFSPPAAYDRPWRSSYSAGPAYFSSSGRYGRPPSFDHVDIGARRSAPPERRAYDDGRSDIGSDVARNDVPPAPSEAPSDITRLSNARHQREAPHPRFGRVSKPPPRGLRGPAPSTLRQLGGHFLTAWNEHKRPQAHPRGFSRRQREAHRAAGPPPPPAASPKPKEKGSNGTPTPPPPKPIFWYTGFLPEKPTGIPRPDRRPRFLPLVDTLPVTGFRERGNSKASYYLETSTGKDVLVTLHAENPGKMRQRRERRQLTSNIIQGHTQDRTILLPLKFGLKVAVGSGTYREYPLWVHLATGMMQPQGLDWQCVPLGQPNGSQTQWAWVPAPAS